MTETPAPDPAAVQIARDALLSPMQARAVVGALTRADMICPAGTLARLAALEEVAEQAWAQGYNQGVARGGRAALDAAAEVPK